MTSAKPKAPFSIRFTNDERARLEGCAGAMPLGAYIKACCFADDAPRYRKRRPMPEADQRLLAEILARLGASRTANNLNQIAKAANRGDLLIDEHLESDLQQAIAEVVWMRLKLMQALGLQNETKPAGEQP